MIRYLLSRNIAGITEDRFRELLSSDTLPNLSAAQKTAVIEAIREEKSKTDDSAASEAAERLRGFLGEGPLKKPEVNLSSSDKRFCKDCVHLVKHPFVLRCDLDNHPVESMDDCPKFVRAKDL